MENTVMNVCEMLSEYKERQKDKEAYNIFRVLEIEEKEVLMCRVLTDFLSPSGIHGKGTKYLEIFLRDILQRMDYEKICEDVHVFKEYPITEERRIDIVIASQEIFIPIEVKIRAEERKAQCFDYYHYAKRKDKCPRVVYLTKYGMIPSKYSLYSKDNTQHISEDDIQCISFKESVCTFMDKIIACEEDLIVAEMAKQYKQAIEKFTVDEDEELYMEIANKLCEREEYFRSMIAIEKSADKAKAKLIYLLMEELDKQMEPILEQYSLSREKEFDWYDYRTQANADYYAQCESTYPGLNYNFSNILLPDGVQLWLRVEVDYNLFAGICLFDTKGVNKYEGIGNQCDQPSRKIKNAVSKYIDETNAQYLNWWVQYWYLPTGYDNSKLEGYKIPNFKYMNEAAIALSNAERRKQFIGECIAVINRELSKIIRR